MFSAYLRRPPCCSGRAPATELATIHPTWRLLSLPHTPSRRSLQPPEYTKHQLRRNLSSIGARRKQDGPAPTTGRDAPAIHSVYNSNNSFKEGSPFRSSKAKIGTKGENAPPTNRSEPNTEFGNHDPAHSNPLFAHASASASAGPAKSEHRQPLKARGRIEEDIASSMIQPQVDTDYFRSVLPRPRTTIGKYDLSYKPPFFPDTSTTAHSDSIKLAPNHQQSLNTEGVIEGNTCAATVGSELQTDFSRTVVSLHTYGEHDLSYSNFFFPMSSATAWPSSDVSDRRLGKDVLDTPYQLDTQPRQEPQFRANKDLRKLVALWAPSANRLREHDGDPQLYQQVLKQEEEAVLNARARALLTKTGYTTANLDIWCWILMSNHANQAAERYTGTVRLVRKQGAPPVPHFVVLQILRAPYIDAPEFRTLLEAIRESHSHHLQWDSRREIHTRLPGNCEAEYQHRSAGSGNPEAANSLDVRSWDGMSAMLLLVRALRHARVVAPASFGTIIELASVLLLDESAVEAKVLSSFCNRLLRLISLPTTAHPIRNILLQQAAQVSVVQRMIAHRPELPINREGYRSLISVQLAHKKVPQEVTFARAKSLTWPPWREDKLGMDASLVYPGRESRALKLLHRMTEAGYAHRSWEAGAKIMAGWDTDNSPTIQTRRLLRAPLRDADMEATSSPVQPPTVWAARIIATRTVREAWAAFLSYRKETLLAFEPLSHKPFEAMFEKLFAQPARMEQMDPDVVPGDGKETWSDPASELDVIYVDKEPPTVEELCTQMRKDGVKYGSRFLSDLLANSHELKRGARYIKEADLDQTWKDVLLAADRYPAAAVCTTLQELPPHLLAAFIRHLLSTKPGADVDAQAKIDAGPTLLAEPRKYALRLLEQSKCRDRVVYIGALKGLLNYAMPDQSDRSVSDEKAYVRDVTANVRFILRLMEVNGVGHDLMTFQHISRLYQRTLRWGPWPRWRTGADPLSLIKGIFAHCVQSDSNPSHWLEPGKPVSQEAVPHPWHLRLLVESLGMFQDTAGLHKLIEWMSTHAEGFKTVHKDIRKAETEMRQVMVVARIFVEGWLTNSSSKGVFEHIKCTGLHIPTPEECLDFMNFHQGWVRRHQRYLQARVFLHGASKVARDDKGAAQPTGEQIEGYPST